MCFPRRIFNRGLILGNIRKHLVCGEFFDTLFNMNNNNVFYHGSGIKITDGFVRVKPAYLTKTNKPITAVFALDDFVHAKLYAIMRLVAGSGNMSPCERDAMYIQRINQNIPDKAYVYELDGDGFQQDTPGSYYCLGDKKIKNTIEIDVMQEIKNGNLKVYVLKDEFNVKNMSKDVWKEIIKDKNKFDLYIPNSQNINATILSNTLQKKF